VKLEGSGFEHGEGSGIIAIKAGNLH